MYILNYARDVKYALRFYLEHKADMKDENIKTFCEHEFGTRSRDNQTYVFAKDTELGMVVETYQQLDYKQQKRLLGYMDALKMNN